ncbi:error-prone DNA polymerase [Streptomyces mirabilis]|uniref:error-prone DNA polymerase n=1 Tax=Streptomyces mirabilis TaxID=68239 RepID=UPI0033DDC4E0
MRELPHLTLAPEPATAHTAAEETPEWAELHTHSFFSLLRGASEPEDLVAEAARLGVTTLALTDTDALTGARRLAQAAREHQVATVYGAELSLGDHGLGTPVVMATSVHGFMLLSEAISQAQLAGDKGHPVYDLNALASAAAAGHWAVLTGCPSYDHDEIPDVDALARTLGGLQDVFGPVVHAELIDHRLAADSLRNDALFVAARRAGAAIVATGAAHYAAPRQARLHHVLTALRHRDNLEAVAGSLHAAPTAHLRSRTEMLPWLSRYPGVRETTLELARRSVVDLAELRPELPRFPVPAGHDDDSWLRVLAERGMLSRYGHRAQAGTAWRQLDHELSVISELSLPGYFLIVEDLCRFAREADIWCQGRGSAANSVVCFALGITQVDPIARDLLFERFLNTERASTPDIDVDFEHRRRDEVFAYAYQRYGRDHAARVANIITFRPRLAVREAARAAGYPPAQIDEMTRHIQHHEPPGPDVVLPAEVREMAAQLDGHPRHLGVHSGGLVLTREKITRVIPVEWATAQGMSVLQADKEDIDLAGCIKIDILSLGMLSALHDACRLVEAHHGRQLDLGTIPAEDPDVYTMITRAQTHGVFQIESRATQSILPMLKPRKFADLVVAVSLIRPGPIQGQSVRPFLRRRAGQEAVTYPHPLAEQALRRSLGVPLYQEQIMMLAMDCGGISAGEADRLRKDLSAKHAPEKIAAWRGRLLAGMAERGIPQAAAEEIFHIIEAFSGYGFPESHATSMAHLVYASAWLKHHYPAAFTCSLLMNQPMGFYSPLTLIGVARRRGISVRGVDLAASGVYATLEPDPASRAGQPAIRLGLATVRSLSPQAAQRIIDARPFTDVDDFARRTRLSARTLEALATAGAFGCFGLSRREALWRAGALATADEQALPAADPTYTAPQLPPIGPIEATFADLWATGSSPDTHPVQYLRGHLRTIDAVSAAELRGFADGEPASLGGLVTHRQRPPTAKGTCFLSIEDETGLANVIVPPATWERYRRTATEHAGLLVHGVVEHARGAVSLVARRLEPLKVVVPNRRRSSP